jgi:ferredoxin
LPPNNPTLTAVPPTAVPAASGCNLNASFVSDVTIPDNTPINAGMAFAKTWRIKNSGTCNWENGFQLVFASGEQMGGLPTVSVPTVAAGATADIAVDLIAPPEPGPHKGVWRIRSKDGTVFGTNMTVVIVVPAPPSVTPTSTSTPVPPTVTPTLSIPLPIGTIVIPPGGIKLLPKTQQVLNQVSVAGNDIGHAVASCPSGSVVTGGGYAGNTNLFIYNSSQSGNGWQVYAKNSSGSSQLLNAYAICLSNSGGSSTQGVKQVSAPGGGIGNAVASCPAGSIVTGGGYAAQSDKSLYIYNSSQSANGWQVYAKNTSGASQLLNAYAICLSATNGTVTQALKQVSAAGGGIGDAVATCPSGSLVTGGGFAGNTNLFFYNTSMKANGWETYARNTSGSSQLLNSYAICATFP